MKRKNSWIIWTVICFMFMALLSGCNPSSNTNNNEESMKDYYKIEDFQSITVGESTYRDVHKLAPVQSMQVTSYGGFCEYPMQNGGYVCIKFYGKDLIVGSIKEIFPTNR